MSNIPPQEHGCNSWIVTRADNGEIVGEFYDLEILRKFNPDKVVIKTAIQHLRDINFQLNGLKPWEVRK